MSFDIRNLNPIGGQSRVAQTLTTTTGAVIDDVGGPAMWSYVTEDAHATVDGAGYFNDASSMLSVGDLIYTVVVSSGAVSTAGFHVVLTNASGVVDCANVSTLTVTDSD